jgi:hypothetical protein
MEMVQGDKWMTPALQFFSLGDAKRYFAAQGIGGHDVSFKLSTGEITLGDNGIKFGSPADPYPWIVR